MKAFILILTIGFSFIACDKDNNPSSEGDPITNTLNFELFRSDGTVNEEDNGQIAGEQAVLNG